MEHTYHRRGIAPWVWVLVVLAALVLVFVIWWAVAAQTPEETVIVPREGQPQPAQPPAMQPPTPPAQDQPVVVERERPVNIYIEREQPNPRVTVVPEDQQVPNAMAKVNLPSQFRYQGGTWSPSGAAVSGDSVSLKDIGASVAGNDIYVQKDAVPPYDTLYLESEPGSGIYIKYNKQG